MEAWLAIIMVIIVCLCFAAALFLGLFTVLNSSSAHLPPGPPRFPIISDLLLLLKPFSELEQILHDLMAQLGPIITLRAGFRLAVFISDHTLAHRALIQNGAAFSDRPSTFHASNHHNINSASYGPTWSVLRRNLASKMFNPTRIRSFAPARKRVLDMLLTRIESASNNEPCRVVAETIKNEFQYATRCLLVDMCFGYKMIDEKQVEEIERLQQHWADVILSTRFSFLDCYKKYSLKKHQDQVLVPLIRARREAKLEEYFKNAYVDTLLELELPEEEKKRKLNEQEVVSLCSEFLTAGTDTTSVALLWIMANVVKYPCIQDKIVEEIETVLGNKEYHNKVHEEDLSKMKYLEGVVLEGLRRHPPAHVVIPHAMSTDFDFAGYFLPKNTMVNFMVSEMGWDGKVWEDPMEFKPERFLGGGQVFDLTGSKEVKMMPFGVGRRMCPGYGLALLLLQYFVANLVWRFQWTPVDDIDLSEKRDVLLLVVMKNPLKARVCLRSK